MPLKVKFQREQIVVTTLEAVRKKGIDGVAAQEVARRLGVSTQPIFNWYGDSLPDTFLRGLVLVVGIVQDLLKVASHGPESCGGHISLSPPFVRIMFIFLSTAKAASFTSLENGGWHSRSSCSQQTKKASGSAAFGSPPNALWRRYSLWLSLHLRASPAMCCFCFPVTRISIRELRFSLLASIASFQKWCSRREAPSRGLGGCAP